MMLKKLFMMLTLLVLLGTTAFAQTTWYVNNQIGNDGRNGLSATIPSPDDNVTGPKRTIGGAQGAIASGVANDIIVVANTGVSYGPLTGEPATITASKKQVFQSTGGSVTIASLFQVSTGALANTVTFNSGAFNLTGGLTLTAGTLVNSAGLVTVTGNTITVAAINTTTKVTGQLAYSGTVNFSYGANYTTADEFPATGNIGTLTTTAGNLTLKTATITATGAITTAGTLNLGGNVLTRSNSAAQVDAFGGNVTNGTLAYNLGGGMTVNGAFTLPTVTVTTQTATARTIALAQPTAITGTLTVSGSASVTSSAALVTIGTAGFTGDAVTLNGIGTVTLTGAPTTINGNVNLSTTGLDGAVGASAQIIFNGGGAVTVNGNVTNQVGLVATNTVQLNGSNVGLITFPNQTITITGNVVNNAQLTGAVGTTTNVTGNGQIQFVNVATNVTINGAMNNGSNTNISSAAGVAAVTANGVITFGNNPTTAIIRIDGGIGNSSNWSGLTGAANTNNGQIVLGGAARTGVGTIGTVANPVGALTNSSQGATNGDGNGNITIGVGDGTASGFFGTSVNVTGSVAGGYVTFGNENFNLTGNMVLSRSNTGGLNVISVGTAGVAAATFTVGGNLDNESKNNIVVNTSVGGAVAVTGTWISNGTGTVSFPNLVAGTVTLGALTVSSGTVSLPATATANVAITGAVNVTGGLVSFLAGAGVNISVGGNASFTGGAVTTTGRTNWTLNTNTITIGGAAANTTFNTAGTAIVVGNPTPTSLVTVTIGQFNPAIPGAFQVNNTTGLATAVSFTGGVLNIAGALTFTAGAVQVTNQATLSVAGNFTNTAGYTTTQQGRITLVGAASTFGGAGSFGNIEFNNGAAGFATSSTVTLAGTIYLTAGTVANTGGAITINNATVLPTVVLNAGSFLQVPTYSSNVNITYIGTDKVTGNELPAAATRLQNLTVATTQGAVAGQGTVRLAGNAQVNGVLTVNQGQALLIDNTFALTMAGPTIALNGDIVNTGTGVLVLAAATGTNISGTGYLPNMQIAAGSANNLVSAKAIISGLLGANQVRGGGDDYDVTTLQANGTFTMNNGTNSATLTLTGVPFDGTDLASITTNNANNTLTLGVSTQMSGNLTHNAGTIALATFTLTHLGTTPAMTGGALINNGTLTFGDGATTAATTLTLATSDVTINANVNINLGAAANAFILSGAGAANLITAGNLTVTKGDLQLGTGGATNLTATGAAVTLTANSTVGLAGTGTGTLRLNAAVAPLTLTYAGTPTIARLRVSNDVNLAGTGTALTVSTAFTHDGGVLNFGAMNLTFQTAFARTAGTYSATTGYMIFDANAAWTVSQGADGFAIPNLRFTASTANNIALTAGAGAGTVTVSNAFDLNTVAQTLTTNGKLAINDGVTVNYTSGAISAAPAYANTIKLVALVDNGAVPANIWPATAGLVTAFTVNNAAAGNTVALPGSRTVNTTLNLTRGTLTLAGNTLTLVSGTTITRTQNGSVTVGAGGITFPADNNVNLSYQPSGAVAVGTGIEFPAVMNNLTVTRSANVANAALTINSAATVNGALVIMNDLTALGAANAQLTAKGSVQIVTDGTRSNATAPVVTFAQTAPLVFGGATGQTLDVTGGQNIAWLRLNLTGTNPALNVTGNLTIPAAGGILFTNGILNMGTFTLTLPNPNAAGVTYSGLSYDRSAVVAPNVGHVVGKVARAATSGNGSAGTNGRFEFPVGTLTGQYRPAAFTFTPDYVVGNPVTLIVSHVDATPTGTLGLPLDGGNGVRTGAYPNFYWLVSTSPTSMTSTQKFDLDLQANNLGVPYTSDQLLRIIRRQDGSSTSNGWSLQGTAANYANYQVVNGVDTTVVARTVSGQGGLILQGSRFAIGIPARAPSFGASPTTFTVAEAATTNNTVQLTATAQNAGETITGYTKISGPAWAALNTTTGLVTLTPDYNVYVANANVFPIVVRATTSSALTADITLNVTVTNTDRPPVMAAGNPATATAKNGVLLTLSYGATDPDGDAIAYSLVSVVPTPTTTPVVNATTGALTWTPAFADVSTTPYVVTVRASSGTPALTANSVTNVTVTAASAKGDANLDGTVTSLDASVILNHVVGKTLITSAEALWAADANNDGVVGALDAAWVLYKVVNGAFPAAKMVAAQGAVEFGKFVSNKGTFSLPINLENSRGVMSVYTEVALGGDVEYKGVNTTLPEGWQVASNFENGVLKIAMAGTSALVNGPVAVVNLTLKNAEASVSVNGTVMMNDEVSASMKSVKVREIPSDFSLSQNYPNPFNPTTTIKYAVAQDSRVSLVVYNILGQAVKTLVNAEQEAGFYRVNWDGTNDFGSKVASGIYIYRITAGNFVSTIKMNLLK